MTQSDDLSKARRIELNIESVSILRQPDITPQASVFGQFDLTSIFAGPFEAGSGANVMTVDVSALSLTLWTASAFVTEVLPDGTPHSGAATYRTWSVQLDQHGQFVQVSFDLLWQWPLPSAVMIFLGCTG